MKVVSVQRRYLVLTDWPGGFSGVINQAVANGTASANIPDGGVALIEIDSEGTAIGEVFAVTRDTFNNDYQPEVP